MAGILRFRKVHKFKTGRYGRHLPGSKGKTDVKGVYGKASFKLIGLS